MTLAPGSPAGRSDATDGSRIGDAFDPALAEHPLRTLRVDEVIDLLHISHWPERVNDYRNAMQAGDRFPPVCVVYLGGRPFLADGHKRFHAYLCLQPTHIVVQVWPLVRWMTDQFNQLRRSVARWGVAVRGLHDPAKRHVLSDAATQAADHWKRILRSLTRRRGEIECGEAARKGPPAGSMTPTALFARLVRECLRDRGRLFVLGLNLVGLAVAQLALTWIVKLWVEGPLITGDEDAMRRLLWLGGGLTVGLTLGVFGSRYLLASVGQRLVQRIRDRVQHSLLGLSMETTRGMHSGDAMSRIFNDAATLAGFVDGVLRRLIGESIVLVGAVSIMVYLNWRVAIATLLIVPIVGFLLQQLSGTIRERSADAQRSAGEMGALLSEQLKGVSTIKAFGAVQVEADRFRQRSVKFRDDFVQSEAWKILLVTLVWGVTGVGLLAAIWYGSSQVTGGHSTPGELLAFCLYAAQTIEPLRRLSDVQGLLQRSLAAAARVYEVIDSRGTEPEGTEGLPENVGQTLRLERVCFSYRTGEPVLHDLDLIVEAGETVGVVATSGGGKSTLASLLIRFADPQRGRITLGGRDLRELRLLYLRRAICFVEQDPFVFSGSLLENLRYGSWNASRQRIAAAVEMADLTDFVRSLPGGLDGCLVEGGRNLSGGQKQRIALARAIVREPSILLLDEATSAIDSDTERQIFSRLMPWLARRTVLAMAHRLSTVSRFPRVVVLAQGRVVGDGSLSGLTETCPEFRLLFAEQLALLRLSDQARERPTRYSQAGDVAL